MLYKSNTGYSVVSLLVIISVSTTTTRTLGPRNGSHPQDWRVTAIATLPVTRPLPGFLHLGKVFTTSTPTGQHVGNQRVTECRIVFGGRLLTILTQEQDAKVGEMMQGLDPGTRVYTSGKYQTQPRAWEWLTIARPFEYSNWGGSNPGIAKYCCTKTGRPDFTWRANPCSEEYRFVCEIVISL